MNGAAVIELAHDSRHLVVAIKPSGLTTTSTARGADSLTARLEAQLGARLHATSRLDRDVTGLVTFARTKRAIAALLDARERGVYRREYLGLASTAPDALEGSWDTAIGVDPRDRRQRVALEASQRGEGVRAASTRFVVCASAMGCVGLRLEPRTGRTHQLRVHAAHAGCPLLGDRRYGGAQRLILDDGRAVRVGRVMLHCLRLKLPDPDGGVVELQAGLPADLRRVWASAGGDVEALVAPPDH